MCLEAHENQQDFANGPLTINHTFIQRPIKKNYTVYAPLITDPPQL